MEKNIRPKLNIFFNPLLCVYQMKEMFLDCAFVRHARLKKTQSGNSLTLVANFHNPPL